MNLVILEILVILVNVFSENMATTFTYSICKIVLHGCRLDIGHFSFLNECIILYHHIHLYFHYSLSLFKNFTPNYKLAFQKLHTVNKQPPSNICKAFIRRLDSKNYFTKTAATCSKHQVPFLLPVTIFLASVVFISFETHSFFLF